MNYTQRYFEEIFESMLNDSVEKGLISYAEEFPSLVKNLEDISNYYIMDKSVIAQMFAKFYEDMTTVYNSIDIDIATGVDLDNIGAIVGVPRPPATSAMVKVIFTPYGVWDEDISIPAGLILSTDQGIKYTTLEEIYIGVDELNCTVECIAKEPGVGSKIVDNTLTTIESEISHNLECTNPVASSGGTEEFNDDQYRELLKNWRLIHLKGSKEAYENYFANFDGIDGYNIVPNWNGSGTIKITLDPGDSYQLNQAYDELQEYVCQMDTDINLFAPTAKPIDVYAIINIDIDLINPFSASEKEQIKSKIKSAIKIFIDGGFRKDGTYFPGLILGEDFIPHKLAVFLDSEIPELKSIDFNYPTSYIEILDEEIGVSNEITIEMV